MLLWFTVSHVINSIRLGSVNIKVEGRKGGGGGDRGRRPTEGTMEQHSCLVEPSEKLGFQLNKAFTRFGATPVLLCMEVFRVLFLKTLH